MLSFGALLIPEFFDIILNGVSGKMVDPDKALLESEERERKKKRLWRMGESQKFQLGTIGALSLSVVSSVSIVICNKALISTLGFTFGEFLGDKYDLDC